ncbi:PAH [Bugula neritina]|uniref:phenylalanine 4-monooxygenase n=1 Tax=Bugula neritina TaxID=10212 RepID=A0A7J7K6C5_BUGNE|nr:PAH [Bugula neritina]
MIIFVALLVYCGVWSVQAEWAAESIWCWPDFPLSESSSIAFLTSLWSKSFLPENVCIQEYPITEYQPIYFAAKSFDDAKSKLRVWAASIPRPFDVRYNAYTQTVEVLEHKSQVMNLVKDIKSDMDLLHSSLAKLSS